MPLNLREVTPADIPALAELHVVTWSATYPHVAAPPTFAIRERQWREAFEVTDGSWFCFVVEDAGRLVGFAKGTPPGTAGGPGQLSKIYLMGDYQRQGLGSRLVGLVAQRFLEQGITSLVLFADPLNPNCRFYEVLGAERMLDDAGQFHGGYRWPDLRELAKKCLRSRNGQAVPRHPDVRALD